MRPAISTFIALLFVIPATTALADHFRSREHAAVAAHELSDDAERFHRMIHRREGLSYLADQAHAFSVRAERVHQMIERGAPYEVVERRIQRLQRTHAQVRESLLESLQQYYDRRALIQWTRVSADMDRLVVESGVDPQSACAVRRHAPRYRYRPRRR